MGLSWKDLVFVSAPQPQPVLRPCEGETTHDATPFGLAIGDTSVVQITGLRNPCVQLDHFQTGLMAAVLDRDEHGNLVRKAGIMGIVLIGGEVKPADCIRVELPSQPFRALERV